MKAVIPQGNVCVLVDVARQPHSKRHIIIFLRLKTQDMKGMECVLFLEAHALFQGLNGGKKMDEFTFAFYV